MVAFFIATVTLHIVMLWDLLCREATHWFHCDTSKSLDCHYGNRDPVHKQVKHTHTKITSTKRQIQSGMLFLVFTHTHTHNDESESLHIMLSSPVLRYCDVTEIFYKLFYWSHCTMLSLIGSPTKLWEILSDPHHVTIEGKPKHWKYHLNCTLFQL